MSLSEECESHCVPKELYYESQRHALLRSMQSLFEHEGPDNEAEFFQSLNAVEVSDQAGQYDSLYDQSKRHALQSAVIDFQHEGRDDNEAQFFQYLNAFEVSDQAGQWKDVWNHYYVAW